MTGSKSFDQAKMRLRGGRLSILGACGLFLASRMGVFAEPALFVEDFQGEQPLANWVISKSSKYAGQPVLVKSANITGFESENTMLLQRANQHYGVALPFPTPVDNKDKAFVVQYEVKMDEPLSCGGAYIKLLEESATATLAEFNNDTPYVIMFGPDKCGATNKVHFILRHQNPVTGEWQEKHAKATPTIKVDRKSNLYTLIIRPDNTFEIQINGVSEKKGSLLEDMDPPVNPPEEIDDPEDSKPEDWVDEAKIPDPNASKPSDWDEDAPMTVPDMDAAKPAGWLDNEPDEVADPEASKPEDWDEEEDGEWEAPLVPNPKCEEAPGCGEWVRPSKANPDYKGKWSAPLIDNPEYKGVWAPRKIRNPGFFTDLHPHNLPKMGALAVEIWTTNSGLRFDNFWVGHDEQAAAQFAQDTWKAKFEAEKVAEEEAKKEFSKQEKASKKLQGGLRNLAEVYGQEVIDFMMAKPAAAIATLIAILASFAYLLMRPSKEEARPKSTDEDEPAAPQDAGVEEKKGADKKDTPKDEDEDEDEDDK